MRKHSVGLILLVGFLLIGCAKKHELNEDYTVIVHDKESVWYRTDGVIDPLKGKEVPLIVDTDKIDHYKVYFNAETYTIIPRSGEFSYYPDVTILNGKYRVRLFDDSIEPYVSLSARFNPWVDAVYSNGAYSYVINYAYFSVTEGNLERFEHLLLVLSKDPELNYDVYYDDLCIYLMSKDSDFSSDYVALFNASSSITKLAP